MCEDPEDPEDPWQISPYRSPTEPRPWGES